MLRNLRRKEGSTLEPFFIAFFSALLANVVSHFFCKWFDNR